MKKLILSLMAMTAMLTAGAELRQDAFTIHTNDGGVQGYLFSDIKKITFSNLDDEGMPGKLYYQELHFADTVLRMPSTHLDSVSFARPRMVYQPNVVLAKETGLFEFLLARDEFVLTFEKSTPANLLPEVGQMLTYFDVDNEILGGTFAGRVLSVTTTEEGVVIATEQPESIRDIYEELVGVETIGDETPGVEQCLRRAGAQRRVSGSGEHSLNFDVPITFEYGVGGSGDDPDETDKWLDPSEATTKGKKFSISGGIRGSLDIRIAYEFSRTRDYISVGTTYEYTPYIHFEYASETTWEQLFAEPVAHPIINIVAPSAPIFTIAFGATPFVKTTGSAKVQFDKTFPTTKMRTLAYYNDGLYKSGKCNANDLSAEDNTGGSEVTLSLEGSFMAGVNMGLYVGTTRAVKSTIGIMGEAYVGPKFTGTVAVVPTIPEGGKGPNTVVYNLLKNNSISMTMSAIELQLSFYREVLGEAKKYPFSSMAFDVNAETLSLVPSFSAPRMSLPNKNDFDDWWMVSDINANARITMASPSGKTFIPVKPGYAIYDENGKYIQSSYSSKDYWGETMDDKAFKNLNWEFAGWTPNKKYKVYPAMQIFGLECRAEPSRTVSIKGDVRTDEFELLEDARVILRGTIDDEVMMCPGFVDLGFVIGTNSGTLKEEGSYEWLGRWEHESSFATLVSLMSNTTYYYAAVAQVGDEMIYGQISSFTTGKRTFKGIDLRLPSGNIWCSVDVKDITGKESANFYSWGDWVDHPVYQEMVEQGWRVPTEEDFQELYNSEACHHIPVDGTNMTAEFAPFGGGEMLSFYGGNYFGGACYYWSCTPIDQSVYTYDEEGVQHLVDTLYLTAALYATYGYNYVTRIDRTEDKSGQIHGDQPVSYRLRLVK